MVKRPHSSVPQQSNYCSGISMMLEKLLSSIQTPLNVYNIYCKAILTDLVLIVFELCLYASKNECEGIVDKKCVCIFWNR